MPSIAFRVSTGKDDTRNGATIIRNMLTVKTCGEPGFDAVDNDGALRFWWAYLGLLCQVKSYSRVAESKHGNRCFRLLVVHKYMCWGMLQLQEKYLHN